ncbi:MAG: FAD-dependent oxidoreductase [Eubacteriales bacterium]|nr:FAD-dependent oxidoreductase [Eubacteriales bacterium]
MQKDKNLYDVVIVGAGPAGLSAAIYMARAKYRTLVLEKGGIGGQITITSEVVNYPGVEKTSGKELTEHMRRQAVSFGAQFASAEVLDMELEQDVKVLHTTRGEYRALGVVLATGANPRKLGFKGEREFQGRGVAYCATCDGEFFTGLEVFVIGGGFAAVEEGIFLTKYAKKVTMIVREPDFTCAKSVADQVKGQDKIEVHFNTELVEAGGEQLLSHARFRNNQTGQEWSHEAGADGRFGIFVFAGYVPNTEWIPTVVERDRQGYLLTDMNRKTNLEGVYAAGDVCVKNLRQVVTAVSDGAVAATSLEKVVSALHAKLELPELWDAQEAAAQKSAEKEPASEGQEKAQTDRTSREEGFLSGEIRQQLQALCAKFEASVRLDAYLDDSPLAGEMRGFLRELEGISDRISWQEKPASEAGDRILPCIELVREDGKATGIRFHGVPGGHEFNSFVIALYNVAGPGQPLEEQVRRELTEIRKKVNLKVLVSLSCTMCPETVMSAQRAAALSDYVEAEMFDLAHFPRLKEKYQVMSVPCLVIDDGKTVFGKKNIEEMAALLQTTG